MSVLTSPTSVPNSAACRTTCATRALHSSFFDGMQATAGHEPPTQRRSTTATFLPDLREAPGELLSALAAAENDDVEVL